MYKMQNSMLKSMSTSTGKPVGGQPPGQQQRRQAWRMRPACAAEQLSSPEAPVRRRDVLLHGTAAMAAVATQAFSARLARAEDGALLSARPAWLNAARKRTQHAHERLLRHAGANPITGTGPPLSFAIPTQDEGVSCLPLHMWS